MRALFFDFDGVILESADIKTRAYHDLFAPYPRWRDRLVAYHLRHAGVSRYEKFKYFYRRFLRRPLTVAERRRLDRAYAGLVWARVLACPFVPGARRFLSLAAGRWPLFILSGTPQEELRRVVRRRGLAPRFYGVYGSPRLKPQLLKALLKRRKLSPKETLYVGDARSDWKAARSCGVPFVGRVPAGRASPFPRNVPCVKDLVGLEKLLRRGGFLS